MAGCENHKSCVFGTMTEAQIEEFVERVANRAANRALAEIGLAQADDKANIKELVELIKNYKVAKKATASALWVFFKDAGKTLFRFASKAVGVLALMYLLLKFGVDPSRIDQLAKVIK